MDYQMFHILYGVPSMQPSAGMAANIVNNLLSLMSYHTRKG